MSNYILIIPITGTLAYVRSLVLFHAAIKCLQVRAQEYQITRRAKYPPVSAIRSQSRLCNYEEKAKAEHGVYFISAKINCCFVCTLDRYSCVTHALSSCFQRKFDSLAWRLDEADLLVTP